VQLGARISMAKNVSGYAPGIATLQTSGRISPLDARTEGVCIQGCRGGDRGGQYRRDRRGRCIETVEIEVVLTLGERQL